MHRVLTLTCFLSLFTAVAHAADAPIKLPADASRWINSPPVTLESLKGKAVVLYFFEEGCPNCSRKWPELGQLSRKYADKPVVFLAISSGTERGQMEQYMRTNNVAWPVVLDPARELEQAAGVGQISLMNITQYRYITADGSIHPGNWQDVPGTVEKALEGASWRVDPTGLPAALKPAWQQVEIGNYAMAAPIIKKAVADKKPELKAAGEKLQTAVEEALALEIAEAEKASAGADKWTTFKNFRAIAERYKGFTLPEAFRKTGTALFNDEEVKRQLAAYDELKALEKGLTSGSPLVRSRTVAKLDKIITDHAGTEAAALAEEIKQQAASR